MEIIQYLKIHTYLINVLFKGFNANMSIYFGAKLWFCFTVCKAQMKFPILSTKIHENMESLALHFGGTDDFHVK